MRPDHSALEIFRGGIAPQYFPAGAEQHPAERRTGDARSNQPGAGIFPYIYVHRVSFHASADLFLPDGYAYSGNGIDFLFIELRTCLRCIGSGLHICLAEHAGQTAAGIGNADRTSGIVYHSDLFPAVILEKMKIFPKKDL